MNTHYQQLIGMGPVAIPLVLREMAEAPDLFDWALSAITGDSPVPEEAAGDLERVAAAWLDWGRRNGYA